jgi:hypothetical protein
VLSKTIFIGEKRMSDDFRQKCFKEYEKLDIPYILNPTYPLPEAVKGTLKIFHVDSRFRKFTEVDEYLHPSIHSMLESVGLTSYVIDLFVTPPGHDIRIHTDGSEFVRYNDLEYNDFCAINFDISNTSGGGLMKWYKDDSATRLTITPIEAPLYYFGMPPSTSITTIAEHVVVGPCLVNTGILHSMKNFTDKNRYCLSIRFSREQGFEYVKSKLDTIWKEAK